MRLVIGSVMVDREIAMNVGAAVERRQQLYVLTGTRKVHIFNMCKIDKKFGNFYHCIGKAVVVFDALVCSLGLK